MNMFKAVNATTIEEYIDQLSSYRKESITFLHNFIQKAAPTLKPHFATNMLGYGSFKYKNHKKKIIDWPTIGLASQKNYLSLYICAIHDGEYIAEKHKAELGKVSVGRSCIRFKTIDDLNLAGLEKVIKLAEKYPGLVMTSS